MAGPRGYRNYRGRTSKGKIALAVVLVLVILAAITVMVLQQYIVYDETGSPRIELPWQKGVPAEEENQEDVQDFDLKIEEPEGPSAIYAFAVPVGTLTQEGWKDAWMGASLMSAPPYNAAAVTLKDDTGKLYFDSDTAVSGSVEIAEDTDTVLTQITGGEASLYTIARISCFHDPKVANSDVEGMGLKNTGGYIFYDGNNSQWLDPGKPAARKYLCDIAKEAAELGFDEILLTDVSYPTEGKLDKIDYGEGLPSQNLVTFLTEMRAALEPYGVSLSIEVPEAVISDGGDSDAWLTLAEIAPLVDRVYARTAPEKVESLTAAVTAAGGTTASVPELEAYTGEVSGSCLIG